MRSPACVREYRPTAGRRAGAVMSVTIPAGRPDGRRCVRHNEAQSIESVVAASGAVSPGSADRRVRACCCAVCSAAPVTDGSLNQRITAPLRTGGHVAQLRHSQSGRGKAIIRDRIRGERVEAGRPARESSGPCKGCRGQYRRSSDGTSRSLAFGGRSGAVRRDSEQIQQWQG